MANIAVMPQISSILLIKFWWHHGFPQRWRCFACRLRFQRCYSFLNELGFKTHTPAFLQKFEKGTIKLTCPARNLVYCMSEYSLGIPLENSIIYRLSTAGKMWRDCSGSVKEDLKQSVVVPITALSYCTFYLLVFKTTRQTLKFIRHLFATRQM